MNSLPARTVATAGVGLVAVVGLALAVRGTLHLSAAYPLKVSGFFAAVMLVAIGYVRSHHPFPRFGFANQVTTLRLVLLALLVGLLCEPILAPVDASAQAAAAAAVSLTVALLDGVDGWIARRTRMASAFGARFDMETDALLILVLSALAWQYGKAGPWVVASGVLRYLFVAASWLLPWMGRPLTPTRRGRAICAVQVLALSLVLVPAIETPASALLAAGGLLALSYSFLVDTLSLWRERG